MRLFEVVNEFFLITYIWSSIIANKLVGITNWRLIDLSQRLLFIFVLLLMFLKIYAKKKLIWITNLSAFFGQQIFFCARFVCISSERNKILNALLPFHTTMIHGSYCYLQAYFPSEVGDGVRWRLSLGDTQRHHNKNSDEFVTHNVNEVPQIVIQLFSTWQLFCDRSCSTRAMTDKYYDSMTHEELLWNFGYEISICVFHLNNSNL